MHVDPIIPPIESAGIVAEIGVFFGRERGAEPFHVGGFENVIVVQNERLEKRNQLDDSLEITFLAGERRAAKKRAPCCD